MRRDNYKCHFSQNAAIVLDFMGENRVTSSHPLISSLPRAHSLIIMMTKTRTAKVLDATSPSKMSDCKNEEHLLKNSSCFVGFPNFFSRELLMMLLSLSLVCSERVERTAYFNSCTYKSLS